MALVITGLAESTGNIYPQIPTGKYKAKINAIEPIVSGGRKTSGQDMHRYEFVIDGEEHPELKNCRVWWNLFMPVTDDGVRYEVLSDDQYNRRVNTIAMVMNACHEDKASGYEPDNLRQSDVIIEVRQEAQKNPETGEPTDEMQTNVRRLFPVD